MNVQQAIQLGFLAIELVEQVGVSSRRLVDLYETARSEGRDVSQVELQEMADEAVLGLELLRKAIEQRKLDAVKRVVEGDAN